MAEKKKQPALRFKGFSEGWKKYKLGELADIVRGASPRPIQDPKWFDENSVVGWLKISDVTEQAGRVHYIEQRISKLGEEKTRVLTEPHLLLSIAASVGKPVVNYVATGVHDGFLIFTNPTFNQEFMFQWMKMFEGQWQKYGQPGSQLNLNSEIVKNQQISVPDSSEQSKIGELFTHLDSLITHHQSKYDKLVTVKTAMLQKMFPQKGKLVPEIRFKGFSRNWEEKNWEETVDISTNMVDPKSGNYDDLFHIGPGNIESFTGRIYDNVLKVKDSNLISGKFHFNEGDIVYGKIRPQLAKYIVAPYDGLASADAYVLNSKNDVVQSYLFVILQTRDFYDYSVSVSARTGMPKINRKELSVFNFFAPNPKEQGKIGNYFKSLDKALTLHKQELEKLQNIKKACLEKMFV